MRTELGQPASFPSFPAFSSSSSSSVPAANLWGSEDDADERDDEYRLGCARNYCLRASRNKICASMRSHAIECNIQPMPLNAFVGTMTGSSSCVEINSRCRFLALCLAICRSPVSLLSLFSSLSLSLSFFLPLLCLSCSCCSSSTCCR